MTFKWFKKYEKPILWVTVIFTVLIFATFSGFSDLQRMMEPDQPDLAGSFTVATTGDTRDVGVQEFSQIRRNFARLFGGRGLDITDEMVWSHLILLADAEGAGIEVSDGEVAELVQQVVSGGQPFSKEAYRSLVLSQLQFASLRAFEAFLRQVRMAERWQEVLSLEASIVNADDAYKRWSVDHEVFDFDALLFPDVEPEAIPDPGDEELQTYYDELPEPLRERRFVEPGRQDIVFGWIGLDADLSGLSEEIMAALEQPSEADVDLRFTRVSAERFPDMETVDDATRELLKNELLVINLASVAHAAYQAGETKDRAAFEAVMTEHGMTLVDPEGLHGPEELQALDPIGSPLLPARLRGALAGEVRFVPSFDAGDTLTHIVFVESAEAERPLAFDEGRDKVLEDWRKQQVALAANEFRDGLSEAARALPAAQEAIAPLEQGARDVAEATIAAAPEELTEVARQAILDQQLAAVEPAINARLAEFESQVWDAQVALLSGIESRTFIDISKDRNTYFTDEADTTTLDFFLKTNYLIFQQAVDGITPVLRHTATNQSAVVKVTARRMLPMADMFADEEGMLTARRRQSLQKRSLFQSETLQPDVIMAAHDLLIAQYDEESAEELPDADAGTTPK